MLWADEFCGQRSCRAQIACGIICPATRQPCRVVGLHSWQHGMACSPTLKSLIITLLMHHQAFRLSAICLSFCICICYMACRSHVHRMEADSIVDLIWDCDSGRMLEPLLVHLHSMRPLFKWTPKQQQLLLPLGASRDTQPQCQTPCQPHACQIQPCLPSSRRGCQTCNLRLCYQHLSAFSLAAPQMQRLLPDLTTAS